MEAKLATVSQTLDVKTKEYDARVAQLQDEVRRMFPMPQVVSQFTQTPFGWQFLCLQPPKGPTVNILLIQTIFKYYNQDTNYFQIL